MEDETRIGYLLQHAAGTMQRQADHMLQTQLGIGMAQFKILMMLSQRHHLQQSKLAECLGQTEASVSRQIKVLADRELLAVELDPHSRRTHVATVTDKGTTLTKQALTALHTFMTPALAPLSAEQKACLRESLLVLHRYTCSNGKPFACDHPFDK